MITGKHHVVKGQEILTEFKYKQPMIAYAAICKREDKLVVNSLYKPRTSSPYRADKKKYFFKNTQKTFAFHFIENKEFGLHPPRRLVTGV
jgi:hypothetical protein